MSDSLKEDLSIEENEKNINIKNEISVKKKKKII